MNRSAILKQAKKYEKRMATFLRDIVAIPSESGQAQDIARSKTPDVEVTIRAELQSQRKLQPSGA